jgi:iron complex outermembrane recepter protein
LGTPTSLSGSREDHAWLPSFRAQYEISPTVMTYLSYAKGFKAGGFNGSDTTGIAANLPFAPEHVNAYELGLKSEWFDRTVLLNLAVFRSDYSGLQVTVNSLNPAGAYTGFVENAAKSRSTGAELEARWAVTRDLNFSANATYDNSRYIDYKNVGLTQQQTLTYNNCLAANPPPSTNCVALGTQDLSGRPTAFAPTWSGSVSGAYRFHLPGDYRLTTALTGLFSSSYFTNDGTDDPLSEQGDYVRLDGRLTFEPADGHWSLGLIGKNLNDENIRAWGFHWPNSLGSIAVQREQGRNVALQFRYQW